MLKEFQRYKLTYILIVLNIIFYLFSAIYSLQLTNIDTKTLAQLGAIFGPYVVLDNQWWRLLTAMFLHGGMTHLLMNMFSLYLVGRGVELYFNTKSYIGIYFFSGLLGGLVSIYMHPVSVGVGASGAIFGIFGALAGFVLAHKDEIASQAKSFIKNFAAIIGLNLVIGFAIPEVDVSAHAAGLFVGILGGYMAAKGRSYFIYYLISMLILSIAIAKYLPSLYAKQLF